MLDSYGCDRSTTSTFAYPIDSLGSPAPGILGQGGEYASDDDPLCPPRPKKAWGRMTIRHLKSEFILADCLAPCLEPFRMNMAIGQEYRLPCRMETVLSGHP